MIGKLRAAFRTPHQPRLDVGRAQAGRDLLLLAMQFKNPAAAALPGYAVLDRVLNGQFEIKQEASKKQASKTKVTPPPLRWPFRANLRRCPAMASAIPPIRMPVTMPRQGPIVVWDTWRKLSKPAPGTMVPRMKPPQGHRI